MSEAVTALWASLTEPVGKPQLTPFRDQNKNVAVCGWRLGRGAFVQELQNGNCSLPVFVHQPRKSPGNTKATTSSQIHLRRRSDLLLNWIAIFHIRWCSDSAGYFPVDFVCSWTAGTCIKALSWLMFLKAFCACQVQRKWFRLLACLTSRCTCSEHAWPHHQFLLQMFVSSIFKWSSWNLVHKSKN